jgi:hypothetical protein
VVAATHDPLGALIFVGFVGSKSEYGPQLNRTQKDDQDYFLCKVTLSGRIYCTGRKWIPGWLVACEIVCEMHVARPLVPFFANCRTHQLLCCGVVILKLLAYSGSEQQQSPGSF